MSENHDRSKRDFSKYDSMSTEDLQEILRLDAKKPQGEESDTEELFYIMEVLVERNKDNSIYTRKSVQEAYEIFQKHYMPRSSDDYVDIQIEPTKPKRIISWIRRFSAVAAVFVILVLATVTVSAYGYDLWGKFAAWTTDFFYYVEDPTETTFEEPGKEDFMQYETLQQALEKYGILQALAPQWLPDGYVCETITASDSPREISIYALYKSEEDSLTISIRQLVGGQPEKVEKSDGFVEAYESNGVTYYLFNNYDKVKVSWIVGEFECYISGHITMAELKAIIDSI